MQITDEDVPRNLLDSAVEHLPQAKLVHTQHGPTGSEADARHLIAVPAGQKLETVDTEDMLPRPRRIVAQAVVDSLESFVAYVKRHALPQTAVWVKLDPATSALSLVGQIEEHARGEPSWRRHSVTYTPRLSLEWMVWEKLDGQPQAQLAFALFIEKYIADVATVDGLPTGAQMLEMALAFEAVQDSRVKSHIRLQNGGAKFEFVGDDDAATVQRMEMFGKFAAGLPVFWGGDRYRVDARLRYSTRDGKVQFWYELIRPDKVHEAAARELIAKAGAELGAAVPIFMGQL